MPIEMVIKIIEETIARFGDGASYDQYREVAEELYPTEIGAMGQSFARNGFIKWLKHGMRQTFNVDEEDPHAPQVQLDLLPGLPAPAYINIGTWQAPRPRRFCDCSVADLDVAIATRIEVSGRLNARIEDLRGKREWLRANSRSAAETVGAVLTRVTDTARNGGIENRPNL